MHWQIRTKEMGTNRALASCMTRYVLCMQPAAAAARRNAFEVNKENEHRHNEVQTRWKRAQRQ